LFQINKHSLDQDNEYSAFLHVQITTLLEYSIFLNPQHNFRVLLWSRVLLTWYQSTRFQEAWVHHCLFWRSL